MKLKNIKETFDNREIKPSAGSWDALSSRLDEEEKQGKKPVFYWLGAIAAVLVAALLIYPSLKNDVVINKTNTTDVVNIENINKQETNVNQLNEETVRNINQELVVDQINSTSQDEISVQKADQSQNPVVNSAVAQVKVEKQTIKNKNSNSPVILSQQESTPSILNTFDKEEEIAVVLINNEPDFEKKLTADEEMELLLNTAMSKLEETAVASNSIAPHKLLREAEWDVESDRRSRIQNKIQDGWEFIKAEAVTMVDPQK